MYDWLLTVKFVAGHFGFITVLGLVSYIIGYRITRRINYDSFLEEVSLCTSLGLGAVAFLIFLLGLCGLLYRSVVVAAIAICVAVSYQVIPELVRKVKSKFEQLRDHWLVGGVLLVWSLPLLKMPLFPPTAFDSTMYFLASAKIFTQNHGLVPTPYLRLPVFTHLNEMLFIPALLFYDDIAAQLVQLLMLFLAVLTVIAFGRNYFSSRTGWWAAALLLASPIVLFFGTVAYVDVSLMLFGTAASYCFWKWLASRKGHWLVMTGAFCGFAASTKYPGLFFALVFGLVTLYVSIREKKYANPFLLTGIVLLIAGPWYARIYYYTGNPVFPFLPTIFGYTFWSAQEVDTFVTVMKRIGFGRGPRDLLALPWRLAFNQRGFDGVIPVTSLYFFALPLLAVFSFKDVRIRKIVGLALAFTLFWFFTDQELRYLMPAFPLMSIAAAASLDMLIQAIQFSRKWLGYGVVTAVIGLAFTYGGWRFVSRYFRSPIPVTQQQRDDYLTRVLPSYPAYKRLNDLRGRNYRVYAAYDENLAYYADGTFMGDSFGPARYAQVFKKFADARVLYEELRNIEADFLLLNHRWKTQLPTDPFFAEHFKLIYSRNSVLVFELIGEVKAGETPARPTE